MSLKNPNSIDLIVHIPGLNQTALVLIDNDNHIDDIERIRLIEQKIEAYSNFSRSSDLLDRQPELGDKDLVITVVFSEQRSKIVVDSIQSIAAQKKNIVPVFIFSMPEFRSLLGLR